MVMICVIPIQSIQHIITFHLAQCTIYYFSSVEAISPLKVLLGLQLPCNIELTEIWAQNASNMLACKTAAQVILWVSLLV